MRKGIYRHSIHKITRIVFPGILFVSVHACKNDPAEIRALTSKTFIQEDRATDVTAIYSQDGKVSMRLFAHDFVRNEHAKRPYIDMNRGLRVEFYNDSGEVANVLTADSSRYYEAQGDIIVWDSVQIVSKKGEKLNTEELIWNEKMQKFFTEKAVKITTPNDILYGDGMEANRDFTWYKITYPKGMVKVNKAELPK
ncbi:MAG: LPS export ABC transporter periplasmic protein LptC [Bacteroidota bacterium]